VMVEGYDEFFRSVDHVAQNAALKNKLAYVEELKKYEASREETEGPISDSVKLKLEEERMKRLKVAYVELTTKGVFVNQIVEKGKENDVCPPENEVAETEIKVAQSKSRLKKLKQESANGDVELRKEFEELAAAEKENANLTQQILSESQAFRSSIASKKLNLWIQGSDASNMNLEAEVDCLTEADVDRLLYQIEVKTNDQNQSKDCVEHEVEMLEEQLQERQKYADELQSEVESLEKTASETQDQASISRQKTVEETACYEALTKLLYNLNGIKDVSFGDEVVTVRLASFNNTLVSAQTENQSASTSDYVLELMLKQNSTEIQAALLTPQSVSIQDLSVLHKNSIPQFILAVQMRLLQLSNAAQ